MGDFEHIQYADLKLYTIIYYNNYFIVCNQ